MKALTTGFGIAAALLAIAFVPAASAAAPAGSVVPPENSAASQYTEAIPTAGGDKSGGGGGGGHRSPAKVLGAHNAHQLETHGKSGREVAEVVADTAPSSAAPVEAAPAPEPEPTPSGGNGGANPAPVPQSQRQGGGGRSKPTPEIQSARQIEIPSGSSGLAQVIGQATGSSSSGELGVLLPLAIAGGILWALLYFRRQRREVG